MSERRLGSTEIGAVAAFYNPALALRLPKNKTAGDVYNRLRWGLDVPRRKQMTRGLHFEAAALDYYAQHVGPWWRALPLGQFWTVTDGRNRDFTASPDAFDTRAASVVIELKTQSEWARKQWGMPGTDEIPAGYLFQVQWLCARCGSEAAHVLAMFGHDVPGTHGDDSFVITEPAIYPVKRDDEVIAQLDAYGERFLSEFVRPGRPPPVKSAHNRRAAKEKLTDEHGRSAVYEWEARCAEHAAAYGLDATGRPLSAKGVGAEADAGDGAR